MRPSAQLGDSGPQPRLPGRSDPDPEQSKRAGVVYGQAVRVANKQTGTAGRIYDEARRRGI